MCESSRVGCSTAPFRPSLCPDTARCRHIPQVDDVGAVCIGNVLEDLGEAKLIAVGHTNGFPKGIGGVSTLMHHYGRDYVPLGSYKGAWAWNATAGRACRVGVDAPHCHTCATGHEGEPQCDGGASADHYLSDLIANYPGAVKSSAEVLTAVEVYRKALAEAEDHSVAIASIGITTNMRDLVLSDPDEHSPLCLLRLIFPRLHETITATVRPLGMGQSLSHRR